MENDTPHRQKLKGMVQEIRDQAQQEAELLPPALARLDQLQATIEAMQAQLNTLQSQMQQLPQQQLQVMQRQEEQRALILKVGQLLMQVNKQTRKEKKTWLKIPWRS